MSFNVLVTGRGTSGSWRIRGEQLGAAIGATVQAGAENAHGFDLVVLVKRATDGMVERFGDTPVVWDVVDAWPQPVGNDWDEATAKAWLRIEVRRIRPAAIVAATQQMARDCAAFGVPTLYLPHHARPEQVSNPIRERVTLVGYEGGEQYLGAWRAMLERQCGLRHWRFKTNPPGGLSSVDIVVALREARGYPVRNWKSNVKLANAQSTGTPCVLSPERGYRETQSGAECWADDEQELAASFERLTARHSRFAASQVLRLGTPHLDMVAETYRTWLEQLNF